jgi:hypothetical protein
VVSEAPVPRFAYTIGLRERVGVELILAGAILYMKDEVVQILNDIAAQLKSRVATETPVFAAPPNGSFTLRKADSSWAKMLMLGAFDYYKADGIAALQIVPDEGHRTIDVPDLSEPWSATGAPAWQWLHNPWTFPVPQRSVAATNLAALRGERITEAVRWEEDEWEISAGPATEVPKDDMRVVPIGTLIAVDSTLSRVVELAIGEGVWRDESSNWQPWADAED